MKKKISFLCILVLCLSLFAMSASAYIQRGTVYITADKESLELKVGEAGIVNITLDPAQEDQMPGCGMSDCPEKCGANCLSKDGNCTCDITVYETYYTEVTLENDAPEVAEAVYADGVLTIKALSAGEATVHVAARLREHLGTSVDIKVTVTKSGPSTGVIAGGVAGAVVLLGILYLIIKKAGKKK